MKFSWLKVIAKVLLLVLAVGAAYTFKKKVELKEVKPPKKPQHVVPSNH